MRPSLHEYSIDSGGAEPTYAHGRAIKQPDALEPSTSYPSKLPYVRMQPQPDCEHQKNMSLMPANSVKRSSTRVPVSRDGSFASRPQNHIR